MYKSRYGGRIISMGQTSLESIGSFGYGFVDSRYLEEGEDEYRFRFQQVPMDGYRHLRDDEIASLEAQGNRCARWDDVWVRDPFDVSLVRRCTFYGLVRLGPFEKAMVTFHDFALETGVVDSRIISSDILENAAVHGCGHVSHYIIGRRCIVYDVDELQTTDHSKFGVGIVKEGEDESVRVTIDLMNEAGGREVLPFVGMNSADAWLWAKTRGDGVLMDRLRRLTEKTVTPKRGVYGRVGDGSVLKNCEIVKDVDFGPACYAKGCNKLKNLTVDSSDEEPTQLGEGIELVNGIVGRGSRIFYGCKAIRFVTGTHCNLKYGARLIHSFLGDNGTVSCCEVLNNLIFPFHEEHHNNSFLIASLVMGQSNMAAGATIGSNHNSRGNDGELVAGRGFWPALSTTLKHDSRFASYTLISKGDYPCELDVRLPFSLVADNTVKGRREVMPAYWWMYNMYALVRNSWKFGRRDRRIDRPVAIETDFLAPDTALEIVHAITLMELWCGQSAGADRSDEEACRRLGRSLLRQGRKLDFEVLTYSIEHSTTPVRILKPVKSYRAYHDMLVFYAMKTIADYCLKHALKVREVFQSRFDARLEPLVNMGGQLVPRHRLETLIRDIDEGRLDSWDAVHERYRHLADLYDEDRLENAVAVLLFIAARASSSPGDLYDSWRTRCVQLNGWILQEVMKTKQKDYENPFRWITYDSEEERRAVLGDRMTDIPFAVPQYSPVDW